MLRSKPPAARLPTPAAPDQPHDHKQQHGADGRGNVLCNDPSAKMNAEFGKQSTGDEGADDSNDDIAKQTKARPLHDLAGHPARNNTNQPQLPRGFNVGYFPRLSNDAER